MKNKKILAIIPARGGSKGIPQKNIKPLFGKPLIAYTIKSALQSKYLDRMIVSTEDKEITKISEKYGAKVIKRPKKLSTDKSKTIDAVLYCLNILADKNYVPDIIVLLQPTSPLRTTKTIDLAIKTFINNFDDYDSLFPLYLTEGKFGKINKKGYYVPNYILGARRQDLEKIYSECGTIFIFKPNLVKEKRAFGNRIFPFIIKNYEEAIDIDNISKFREAEYLIKQKQIKSL